MQIHRVRGNDLKDALQRARKSYGEGALVISHEVLGDGGVTLAVAQRPPLAGEKRPAPGSGGAQGSDDASGGMAPSLELPPGYEEVCTRLRGTGCGASWIQELCRRAASLASANEHPMDAAGRHIGGRFQIAHLPRTPGVARVIAFVGYTGVGKTTGLVKLGARLVRNRRLVSMATLDSRRVGAVEQYRAYAELLQAPLHVLKSDQVLSADLLGADGKDVVLLDTSGRADYDLAPLMRLQRNLERSDASLRLDNFLVFPAGASRSALREVTEQYCDLRLAGCVITKLDETRQPAPVLEHVVELGLPVAFLSDGQDLAVNFRRATPEVLADLMLLGRVG